MLRKTLIAGTAIAVVAASGYAFAQTPPSTTPTGPNFTKEDHQAFIEGRIAGMKAALKLTPEQEKLWPAVEKAMRDLAAEHTKSREALGDKKLSDLNPVERIRFRATTMAGAADGLKKLADASEPLYKTLDENQKRRLTFLTHRMDRAGHHGDRHGGFGRHHFGRWGGADDGRGPGMMGPGGMGQGGMGPGGMGQGGMGPGGMGSPGGRF